MGCIKSLVLFDEGNKLVTVSDRERVARDLGLKTFKTKEFKILDILGRFSYGFVAVYEFERSTGFMGVRSLDKRM